MNEKEPNNSESAPARGFKLPGSRILRGRQNFENLFSQSSLIKSSAVNLRFVTYTDPGKGFKIGFIAPKNIGNAVQRNRCKRLLREAFRANQAALTNTIDRLNIGLHAVLIARHKHLDFESATKQVSALLGELDNRLKRQSHSS